MTSYNLHFYPSPITHESRMLKETKSIADAGLADQICLIGMSREGLPGRERLDEKRQIWRVKPTIGSQQSGVLFKTARYIEWQAKIIWAFRACHVKFVNCHSLPVLSLGFVFKWLKKAKLVYDTHELETETDSAIGFKRLLYKMVEGALIHHADAVITVNESIAQWYRDTYRLKEVYAVRNVPYQSASSDVRQDTLLRTKFGIRDREILYIFQGALTPTRGIEIMLDVFARLDHQKHIVFMGFGPLEASIKQYERAHRNIHFHDAVKPEQVARYSRGADVGICLQENVGLNHYLSLPNKFFEYIMNGLPVIASDFPEMARIIDSEGCGWKVPVDREALFSLINALSIEDIAAKRNQSIEYRRRVGWQHEEQVLLQAYGVLFEYNNEWPLHA